MKSLFIILLFSVPIFSQVTTQPINDTVPIGGTASFTITGTGSYQWYRNDTLLTGETSTSLSYSVTRYNSDDKIYCTANGDTSSIVYLVVTNPNIVHLKGLYTPSTFRYTPDITHNIISYAVCYDTNITNAPVIVMGHGINGTLYSITDGSRERLVNKYNAFVIAATMRGRNGSTGTQDCGGREIHDLVDAIRDAMRRYPSRCDTNNITYYGISGGGGNSLSLATKFPDMFNFIVDCFGMSDYADWYNEGDATFQGIMNSWIGCNPTACPDQYASRSQINVAKNAYLPRIWIYADSADPYVGAYNSEDFYSTAVDSGLTNITLTITTPDSLYRAIHGYPNIGSSPDLIRIEPQWADVITDTSVTSHTLPDSGWFDVGGYVCTKNFDLIMGDGRSDLGHLYYNKKVKSYTLYNGSTDNTVDCKLIIKNISSPGVRAIVNGDSVTALATSYNEVMIPFTLTDTVAISYIEMFDNSNVAFALLPAVGNPDTVYQGPKNTGDPVTVNYSGFASGYGWLPPEIKFRNQATDSDSLPTSYSIDIDSITDFAVSMWFHHTGACTSPRAYFSINETATTSYLWLYQSTNFPTRLQFRVNVDNQLSQLITRDFGIDTGYNHLMFIKNDKRMIVLVNGSTWLDTTIWNYTGTLSSHVVVGNLTTNGFTFNSDIKSFIVYDSISVDQAIHQNETELLLGPSLHSYMENGALYDSTSLLPMSLDSVGISQFALYHTETVDSVYVDGVLAVSEEAGVDSVLVTPASPMMWRSSAYPIRLYSDGDSVTFQYFVKKSLGVLSNFATSIQTGLGF